MCYQMHGRFADTGQFARSEGNNEISVDCEKVCNAMLSNKLAALHFRGAIGTAIASH